MFVKSPIHYMGCKFDLLPYLIEQFPKKEDVSVFYDIFGGSATISMNVPYNKVIYNELDCNLCNILKMLKETKPEELVCHIKKRIEEFDLNNEGVDIRGKNVSEEIIKKYKNQYLLFRDYYNKSEKDVKDLFTLSFYSFCNLMRFNSNNEFNTPYGSRCFIKSDINLIYKTHKILNKKNIYVYNLNAFNILSNIKENEGQFLYLDPPYQNSGAIYNDNKDFNGWTLEDDERLFCELDRLTSLGIKWAYSNVLEIKGKTNNHIEEWAVKNGYTIIDFEQKQYSSIAKGNANAREVLIINYEQRVKKYSIFDFGVEV